MTGRQWLTIGTMMVLLLFPVAGTGQEEGELIFAVVTQIPKDRRQVTAHIYAGGTAQEATLLPADAILDNPIWKKLEVCHSLRLMGTKSPEGYRILSLKNLDAGMLPMALQGIAGDCLTKKALEFAPAID
jgi:hypothetical protein